MRGPPLLIAADSSVLIDEELGGEDAVEALSKIKRRLPQTQVVVTETALQELAYLSRNGISEEVRAAANGSLRKMLARGYTPLPTLPIERETVAQIALKLRVSRIIPCEEKNDSLVVAEAAMKGCSILLSSDAHLQDAHYNARLWKVLQNSQAKNQRLVIARPSEIARK
jgi:predicted nucleic acid-binding protein